MSGAILKYLLRFINEYGDLETVEPEYRTRELLGSAGEASGEGG